jgi:colanic acid biosynthesis glycosyl transferase WcaI
MRVLLLNQTFYPDEAATSQQLLDLAKLLKSRGCSVTVLASRRAYYDSKKLHPASDMVDGIKVVRVGCTGFGRSRFRYRLIDGLSFEFSAFLKLLFFPRQDVVLAFTSPPLIGVLAVLFCRLRGGKAVQWVMDLNPDIAFAVGYLKPESLFGRLLTQVLRWSLRSSRHVVVLDRWMRQRVLSHGVKPENVVIVPPWPLQETALASPELGERFKAKHGIGERFVVLFSGNHSIAHPLETVLEAAKRFREEKDTLFLFVGGGLRAKEVTLYKEQNGLQNIQQLSHQPRALLSELFSAANLHLVVMGNPLSGLLHVSKIYGVLSTGSPFAFIGPKQSHVADLISKNVMGFHVEQGDTDGLCAVIRTARSLGPKELLSISQENPRYVQESCTAEVSLADFFSEVIETEPENLPITLGSQFPSRT